MEMNGINVADKQGPPHARLQLAIPRAKYSNGCACANFLLHLSTSIHSPVERMQIPHVEDSLLYCNNSVWFVQNCFDSRTALQVDC